MKFSEAWLREWVDPAIDTDALVARLTAAGLEVDSAEPVGPAIEGVVVVRVAAVRAHPNADKLALCEVDAGAGARARVVCGAPNVAEGMLAAWAAPGARLPGAPAPIARAEIRGEASEGMLCSARELGLGDEADGIVALPGDAPVGAALDAWLGLDDAAIDVDLTPNRGDCLGLAGIAREVGVLTRAPVTEPSIPEVAPALADSLPVALDDPQGCPRYVGRVVRGVDPAAATPMWMRERLRRCGVRPIGVVVDVTNYVMLELGQPMHAFDLARLRRGIRVRRAAPGERLVLLDGAELELDSRALVIADEERAVALAGVMGGLDSAVSDATADVFLESAWFEPKTISLEARRLGLHTDASHRFERAVATDLQRRAMERATALLVEIAGGRAGPVVEALEPDHLPQPPSIRLRPGRIRRLLGCDVPAADVEDILGRLGFAVERDGEDWRVVPPPSRSDVAIEADLVEELARVTGYDNLPSELPTVRVEMPGAPESRVALERVRAVLVDRGYQEAITYSFVDPALQRRIDPDVDPVALSNPISSEMAVMRTTVWPGLLEAVAHNANRQQERVRLFEAGRVFRPQANDVAQRPVLAAVATGTALPEQWGMASRAIDFYDVKGDVEALIALTGCPQAFEIAAAEHPALHPGQSAAIGRAGRVVGHLGALHPRLAAGLKLAGSVFLLEIELEALGEGQLPEFEALSRYPAVRRDLAVIVPEAVTADAVRKCVGQAGVDVLQNLELFDVYRGESIDSGKKSLALGLTFQAASRTLGDPEVDAGIATILDSLTKHLGATLRG